MSTPPPRATYRLQFREGMDFVRAATLAPYWQRLGISHLYASPVVAAATGSTHGYDVADFNALEPSLGGEAGFREMCGALRAAGLGLILDFVPNHMSDANANPWWFDVLEWGPQSPFAGHFDIDWESGPLMRPLLGEPYGDALEAGALTFDLDAAAGRIHLRYGEHELPLTPPSCTVLLERSGIPSLAALAPAFSAATPDKAANVRGDFVRALAGDHTAAQLADGLETLSRSTELVHAVHEAQHWRLALWRAARDSLNYRRFFEITGLVGVRVEDVAVFDDVHRLLLRLIGEGLVDGIRLDHIDGLADPAGYLDRLRAALPADRAIPIYVEKILEPGEDLPAAWPVDGTTGYEFTAAVATGLVDGAGLAALGTTYDDFVGVPSDFEAEVRAAKLQIVSENLAAELGILTKLALDLAGRQLAARDYGEDSLRRAVRAMIVAFPVYRTYVSASGASSADRALLDGVCGHAKDEPEIEDPGTVDFVASLLRLDVPAEDRDDALRFAIRFQQTTGPVMAKALEDTAFYRWHRLIALNEVGGDPVPSACGPEAFHQAMLKRSATQPHGLSATATHDTKRGEDARARLYALSENPAGWATAVARWSDMNAPLRTELNDGPAPEPETEWMIYQALLGAWPPTLSPDDDAGVAALSARFAAFLEKALREAKRRTRWSATNDAYERAVLDFAAGLFASPKFLADFHAHGHDVCRAGAINSLAQLLLKLTAPGVPDIYQGTEFWDHSMVDPDNRQAVPFDDLALALNGMAGASVANMLANWREGLPKLHLMQAVLAARRDRPTLFAEGDYRPLELRGTHAGNAIAFARTHGAQTALVIAPRCVLAMLPLGDGIAIPAEAWGDTAMVLPGDIAADQTTGEWRDIVTGASMSTDGPALPLASLPLASLFANFPVACLVA